MSQTTPPSDPQEPGQHVPPPAWQQPAAGPQYGYAPPRRTNSMAVVSLVAGIAGLTVLPVLASIVAVITAPMARREIARTGEEGGTMATAGLVTGWIGVGIGVLIVLGFILITVFSIGIFATAASTVGEY